jgi:hypothetical protein
VEGRDDRDVQEDDSRQDMLRGHGSEPGAGRWRVGFEGSSRFCGLLEACGDAVLGANNPQGKKKYR